MMKKILLALLVVMTVGFIGLQGMFGTILIGDVYDVGDSVEKTLITEVSDIDDYSDRFYYRWQVEKNGTQIDTSGWERYEETGTVSNSYKDSGIRLDPAYAGTISDKDIWTVFGWEKKSERRDSNNDYYRKYYEKDFQKVLNDADFWVKGGSSGSGARFGTYSAVDSTTATHITQIPVDSNFESSEMIGRSMAKLDIEVKGYDKEGIYHEHPIDVSKVDVGLDNDKDGEIETNWDSRIDTIQRDTGNKYHTIGFKNSERPTLQEGDVFAVKVKGIETEGRKDRDIEEKFKMRMVKSDGSITTAEYQFKRDKQTIDKPTFFIEYDQKIENFNLKSVMRYNRDGTVTNMTDRLKLCNGELTTSEMTYDNTDCDYKKSSGLKGDNVLMFRFKDEDRNDAYTMEHYKLNYEVELPKDKKADGVRVVAGKDGSWDDSYNTWDFSEVYYDNRVEYPLIGDGVEVDRYFAREFQTEGVKKYRLMIANDQKEVIANTTYDFKVYEAGDPPAAFNELESFFSSNFLSGFFSMFNFL